MSSFLPTICYRSPSLCILHKPGGMPLTGKHPNTLSSHLSRLSLPEPHSILSVPRCMSGPAILTFNADQCELIQNVYNDGGMTFRYEGVLHGVPEGIDNTNVTIIRSFMATCGMLSHVEIVLPNTGEGLRKRLQKAGNPAVGTVANTRKTHSSSARGLFIVCCSLSIPCMEIDVNFPIPPKLHTLIQREQKFGSKKMEMNEERLAMSVRTENGVVLRRFLDWFFIVDHSVMKPRESTQLVAKTAAQYLSTFEHGRILDMGTGSGCILISTLLLSKVDDTGVGLDINERCLDMARRNVERFDLTKRVELVQKGFSEAAGIGQFDVIVSNPPYLSDSQYMQEKYMFEDDPKEAIVAANRGMGGYEEIGRVASGLLAVGGQVVLEIGARTAVDTVVSLFEGLYLHEVLRDVHGFERCLVLRKNG